MFIITNITTR